MVLDNDNEEERRSKRIRILRGGVEKDHKVGKDEKTRKRNK